MAHLMAGEHLRAWSLTQAKEFYDSRDYLNVSLRDVDLETKLLAAKIAASYLIGATHAFADETERLLKVGPRPTRATAPAQRVGEAGAEGERQASSLSGAAEPKREGLA